MDNGSRYSSLKSSAKPKSPRRDAINKQLDQHTNRIKQLMQQDYILLEEENAQLKVKCMKVHELQDKVELVLKSNEQLFVENQKLAKLVEEKIDECEIWKRKVESTKRANQGMNQYERKKLLLEIQRLQKQIQEIEHLKNITIKQIKTKHMMEIDTLRKDHELGIKLYDDQLIKLKELADKKEIEVGLLEAKLRKSQSQSIFQANQGKEERARLKEEVKRLEPYVKMYEKEKEQNQRLQAEKKKQDQASQAKLKQLVQKSKSELDQCRAQLKACKETLQEQNTTLLTKTRRQDKKIQDLDQRLQQLRRQKQQIQSTQQRLLREVDSQKHQIKQLTLINNKEFESLQQKYESLRVQELSDLQATHDEYRNIAEAEMRKLADIIRIKEEELLFLSQEKSRMKQIFIEEGNQMKNQLIILQNQFRENQVLHRQEIRKLQQQWKTRLNNCETDLLTKLRKGEEDSYMKMRRLEDESLAKQKKLQSDSIAHKNRLQSQLITLDKQKRKIQEQHNKKLAQITAYKEIIESQKEEFKQLGRKSEEREKFFKKSQQEYKNTIMNGKSKIERLEEEYQKYRDDSTKTAQQKDQQFKRRLKQKQTTISRLQKQNEEIKQFVSNRDRSLIQLHTKIQQLNRLIDQKQQTIDSLRAQVVELTQKNSTRLANEKASLHEHYASKIKFLSEDFTTRILLLQTNIADLTQQLATKDKELQQLLRQYKKMREQMTILSEQEANKKEISLKFAGATADLIASKSMFDVFVKGKVLDVCGHVVRDMVNERVQIEGKSQGKQNKSK